MAAAIIYKALVHGNAGQAGVVVTSRTRAFIDTMAGADTSGVAETTAIVDYAGIAWWIHVGGEVQIPTVGLNTVPTETSIGVLILVLA